MALVEELGQCLDIEKPYHTAYAVTGESGRKTRII